MDHFPIPEGAEHIPVPNKTVLEYSRGDGGFVTYPARCGWSPVDLTLSQGFNGRAAEDVESFFQSWLYFGVIIEVLGAAGVPATTADFLDPSKQFVSTKRLPRKLRQLKQRVKDASEGHKLIWHTETTAVLSELSRYLWAYCDSPNSDEGDVLRWPLCEEITMSMISLAHTLDEAVAEFYTKQKLCSAPSSTLLRRRMKQSLFCPMDIQRVVRDMGIDGHYYIANLPKPLDDLSHDKCSDITCVASHVDEAKYVTKHSEACSNIEQCNNQHVEIDVDLVVSSLRNGGFPVVSWRPSEAKLDVTEFNAGKGMKPTFVAISHVWADGMGNAKSNALPRCQLERLQSLVNDTASGTKDPEKPMAFWMDTLCIPVAKHLTDYRKLSIRRMEHIYKSSSAVLVIDSLMCKASWEGSLYTTSLHIYFSGWVKRLWTFQEGMLAQDLILQFADKSLSYRENINFFEEHKESIRQGHSITFPHRCTVSVMSEFVILRDFINGGLFGADDFMAVAPMVAVIQHRATSRESDQTLCASAILGKDPGPLYEGNKGADGRNLEDSALQDCRMKSFMKMIGRFPSKIIFNRCRRLQEDGFRWAPRSFLGNPKNGFLEDVEGGVAVLTEGNGLSVNCGYPGFIIKDHLKAREVTQVVYNVTLSPQFGGFFQVQFEELPDLGSLAKDGDDEDKQFVVIFRDALGAQIPGAVNGHSQLAVIGTALRIERGKDGVVTKVCLRHEVVARMTSIGGNASTIDSLFQELGLSSAHSTGSAARGHNPSQSITPPTFSSIKRREVECEVSEGKTHWFIL